MHDPDDHSPVDAERAKTRTERSDAGGGSADDDSGGDAPDAPSNASLPPETSEASARFADVIVRQATDAIVVTDRNLSVTRWNPAAERLYGIPAAEAIGRRLTRLLPSSDFDGIPINRQVVEQVRRENVWRGRVVHRPQAGPRIGAEVIVDSVVSGLRDESWHLTGLVAINRDVTATARLEAEVAALGSLAAEAGRARSPREIADAALVLLSRATAADGGLIVSLADGGLEVLASRGISGATIRTVARYPALGVRLEAILADPEAVIVLDVDETPVGADIQQAFADDGIRHVLFVGLRVGGKLLGLLGLGWATPPDTAPSSPAVLQAAALVASALANARLVERLERGLEQERRLTARLEALVELTRLPQGAGDDEALARFLLDRVVSSLGAVSGFVLRAVGGLFVPLATHNIPRTFEHLRATRPVDSWSFYRRLAADETAFIAAITRETLTDESYEAAREAGYRSYAAFPIHDEGQLSGTLLAFFGEDVDALRVDERTLEAIGRMLLIAFANQRLRRTAVASEERYRTLFEESPDALALQTPDGRIVDANNAALRMYGADRDWLIGRLLADVSVSERMAAPPEASHDRTGIWRAVGRRADGSAFPQEVIVSRVELDDEPQDLVRIRDLTEQEQLQEELVQAQKMEAIGQLVSGVAHELNNPLAAIIAFSQLIRRDPRLPADMQRDADLLVGEADRTRRIVQNLLDFARQRRPERHPTSLRTLVESVLELQAYSLNSGSITVRIDLPDDLPPVHLDRAQMQQVFLNLTLNAIQAITATKDPGTIVITARRLPLDGRDAVRVSIADDGPGVDPANRDRLLLPFFTTKEPGEGTGLGLPVSFGIVAAHGGHLSYEPGPGSRGSVFVISLPIEPDGPSTTAETEASSPPVPVPARTRRPAPPPTRPRVLVLDDEPSIRAFLMKALGAAGFDPVATSDGRAALDEVRARPFAAVLCDYRMAGMSGTEVFAALVAVRAELSRRFIFMSGDVLNAELAEFADRHGIAILAKPFDLDTVQRAVAALVTETSGA